MTAPEGGQTGGPVREIQDADGTTLVKLHGDIDLYCSPEVRKALLEATQSRPATLAIDLSKVPHMDSSGVATLVEALQRVKRYKGRMALVAMQERVRNVFEIARLTDLFEIRDTLAEVQSRGG
ncbi:MAG: STAS domain-containing protein [Phycisphaerae bacterium]|nr:STAS domain-containing protein [Phycisphaerae bacterium]